jgi:hypothetical protein
MNQKHNFATIIQNEDNTNDNKRLMLKNPSTKQIKNFGLVDVDKKVLNFCNEEFNGLKKSSMSIILSLKGCQEQQKHTDYDTEFTEIYKSRILLVAIMDNTKIIVWNKYGYKHRVISIPKGSIFIGRGTLVHAGSEYDIDHLRLHYYVDYKNDNIVRDDSNEEKTYLINWDYTKYYEKMSINGKNLAKYKRKNAIKCDEQKEQCRKRMKILNDERYGHKEG